MDPFIGEIRIFSFNYAPVDWAFCNGQTLSFSQNQALYAVIGMTYGGNNANQTYMLPNLMGLAPVGTNPPYFPLAQPQGAATVSLNSSQVGPHTHEVSVAVGPGVVPPNNPPGYTGVPSATVVPAQEKTSLRTFGPGPANAQLHPATIGASGQTGPHNNLQPYLVLNFCIALNGVFPMRS